MLHMPFRHISLVLLVVFLASPATAEETAFVQVRETKIRSQAKIWAPAIATLSYGDSVTKVSEDGGWCSVKKGVKSGYLPSASLSLKHVVLSSKSSSGAAADPTDAILAGKGFDKGTEEQFASTSHGNFSLVDQMEKVKVSDSDLRDFILNGKLNGGK